MSEPGVRSRLLAVRIRDESFRRPDGEGRSTTAIGQDAEREAVRQLRRLGYRIVDRNVRTARGEIDVIAWEGRTLCFVEVKSRRRTDYGGAQAAVDRAKQMRLWRAAEAYLALDRRQGQDTPECRFDVVAMQHRGGGEWFMELFRDAF